MSTFIRENPVRLTIKSPRVSFHPKMAFANYYSFPRDSKRAQVEDTHPANFFLISTNKGINHKPQTTYNFKDCTFDDSKILTIDWNLRLCKTIEFRDSNSDRAIFASDYMDTNMLLREFCGKETLGSMNNKSYAVIFVLLQSIL